MKNKISQIITFPQVAHFHDRLCERYDLRTYDKRKEPTFCFGCHPGSPEWVKKILKHRSLLVLIWAGSDSMYILKKKYADVKKSIMSAEHIKHVAISKYISKDLKSAGFPYKFIPITQVLDEIFKPTSLGNRVFYYDSHSPRKSVFYGTPIVKKVLSNIPNLKSLNGYSGGSGHTIYADMPSVYRRCFLGLRLTPHDGLPNTVVEMGLMGRKCVCNHELPNCIPWKNEYDVIDAVKSEMEKTGSVQDVEETARRMREYINIPTDWLFEDYWVNK